MERKRTRKRDMEKMCVCVCWWVGGGRASKENWVVFFLYTGQEYDLKRIEVESNPEKESDRETVTHTYTERGIKQIREGKVFAIVQVLLDPIKNQVKTALQFWLLTVFLC